MFQSKEKKHILFIIILLSVLGALLSPMWISSYPAKRPSSVLSPKHYNARDIAQQHSPQQQHNPALYTVPRPSHDTKSVVPNTHQTPNNDLRQYGRVIDDYQLSDLLLATDIEGGLYALNRETGEIIWHLPVDDPLVDVRTNYSQLDPESSEDTLVWIVEPYGDGNLYFFNKEAGLNKLPVSISQLVLQSPFALNGDDKIYTGVRKSSLYSIDLINGKILSSFGSNCPPAEDFCSKLDPMSGKEPDCSNVMMVGKTTYELTIHSRDNVYWNVTYSTWGPNNMDTDLAFQNNYPMDSTYIAPIYHSKLAAFDLNNKKPKWQCQLNSSVVNVFDILHEQDYKMETSSSNPFMIIPHPLKPPSSSSPLKTSGTYLDLTNNGSWYAMSGEFYPSLIKSAPTSRYTLNGNRKYTGPDHLDNPHHFNAVLIGVHVPVDVEDQFNLEGNTGAMMGYPTDFPQQYPYPEYDYRTETPKYNDFRSNSPPSRTEWVGLPSSSANSATPLLQLDPSPRDMGFFSTVFGKFLWRCFENMLMVCILFVLAYLAITLKLIPPVSVLLRRNGLELKELDAPVFPPPHAQDLQNIEASQEKTIDSEAAVIIDRESNEAKAEQANSNDKVHIKKEVKIVEPLKEERSSNDNNGTLKKRKRGARGGKKNKKNNENKDFDAATSVIHTNANDDLVTAPNSASSNISNGKGQVQLKGLTLSDTILGYGSYGTVVFKGTFLNRDVAIKRMLIDFYDVASHEINLLTESDDHPNVIRYFYSETSDKFLYIALELCSASLEDFTEKSGLYPELLKLMEPVNVLEQIAKGLHHLHSLKIVHRDIKPQNILVAPPKKLATREEDKFTPVRILISDFGLCKKLEADESSFRATTQHAAGTAGWRAPELLVEGGSISNNSLSVNSELSLNTSSNSIAEPLVFDTLSNRRLTRAIDIFSLGCVFFYILTNGSHPFGERYLREANVVKGDYSLDALDILTDNVEEAKDLISKMISRNPKLRPNTSQVLKHPYFWPNAKKLEFLLKVSDRYEIEQRDPPSELLLKLENSAETVIGKDWCSKFDKVFMDNLGKYRKYHGDRLMDLLRALRNKYHHFNDLPVELVGKMSPLPDGFYQYFNKRFPNLLMEIYKVVEENLTQDHVLGTFF